jgi:hypothetical protein
MTMGWSTQVSPDQSTEFLTMESARVFTAVASDPLTQRRAMRFIVAWSQGISGSTVPGTGIAHHLAKSADAFSADDLAALRTMSGCA